MNQKQCDSFLEATLNIARLMLQYGAEIWKVEDAFTRICKSYNISKVEIHAITTQIVATIKTEEGIISTQSVRVGRTSNNLGALEALNTLSRNLCSDKPPVEDILKMTTDAVSSVKMSYYNCIGYVLSAGAFAVFFGGTWLDGLVASIIGVFVYFMDKFSKVEDDNKLVLTMIMSFIAGTLSVLFGKFGIGDNVDKIIIGVVMLFIPSLALINGVKDMFYRNIMSGLYRVIEAVLTAASIAIGFGSAVVTMGGIL